VAGADDWHRDVRRQIFDIEHEVLKLSVSSVQQKLGKAMSFAVGRSMPMAELAAGHFIPEGFQG
jgi:hypothetical protein